VLARKVDECFVVACAIAPRSAGGLSKTKAAAALARLPDQFQDVLEQREEAGIASDTELSLRAELGAIAAAGEPPSSPAALQIWYCGDTVSPAYAVPHAAADLRWALCAGAAR